MSFLSKLIKKNQSVASVEPERLQTVKKSKAENNAQETNSKPAESENQEFLHAANEIIGPLFMGSNLESALFLTPAETLKQNIQNADLDMLTLFVKYLAQEAEVHKDSQIIQTILNFTNSVLSQRKGTPGNSIRLNPEKDVFLCPFIYEGEEYPLNEPDLLIHSTVLSSTRIQEGAHVWNIGGIPQGYQLATKPDGRKMHLQMLTNQSDNSSWIPLFMGLGYLFQIFGSNIRVAFITLEDAQKLSNECAGIVIGPGLVNMSIPNQPTQGV